MNLPASALEFLDAFRGYKVVGSGLPSTPTIHVHCFASKDRKEAHQSIYERAEKALGCPFGDTKVSIHNVRDVAPNKNMYCVTFQLPEAVRSLPRIKVGSDDSIP
ncbi:hypothetical protein IV203_009436 [Nitzschia inconspicua]|nr:hypothetical protein IV203_009436 [Nitzschia inconspicua]